MTDNDYIDMKLDEKPILAPNWFLRIPVTSTELRDAIGLSVYFLLVSVLTCLLAVNFNIAYGILIGYALSTYGIMTVSMMVKQWMHNNQM